MKLAIFSLGAASLCTALIAPMTAFAADRDFCRDYAESAYRLAREVRAIRQCAWQVEREPAVWSLDRRGHYEWCLYTPGDVVAGGRAYRDDFLRDCRSR